MDSFFFFYTNDLLALGCFLLSLTESGPWFFERRFLTSLYIFLALLAVFPCRILKIMLQVKDYKKTNRYQQNLIRKAYLNQLQVKKNPQIKLSQCTRNIHSTQGLVKMGITWTFLTQSFPLLIKFKQSDCLLISSE